MNFYKQDIIISLLRVACCRFRLLVSSYKFLTSGYNLYVLDFMLQILVALGQTTFCVTDHASAFSSNSCLVCCQVSRKKAELR